MSLTIKNPFGSDTTSEKVMSVRYESIKVPNEFKEQDPTKFLLENFELAATKLAEKMRTEEGREKVIDCEMEAQLLLESAKLEKFDVIEYATLLKNYIAANPKPRFKTIVTKTILMNKFMNLAATQGVKLDTQFMLLSNLDLSIELATVESNNVRSLNNPVSFFNNEILFHGTAVIGATSELYRSSVEDGDNIEEKQAVEKVLALLAALYSGDSVLASVAGDETADWAALDVHAARRHELQKLIPGIRSEAFAAIRLNLILDYISMIEKMSDETIKLKIPNVEIPKIKELAHEISRSSEATKEKFRIQANHSNLMEDRMGNADLDIVIVVSKDKLIPILRVEVKTYKPGAPGDPMLFMGYFKNEHGDIESVGPKITPETPESNIRDTMLKGTSVLSIRVPRNWATLNNNTLPHMDEVIELADGTSMDVSMLNVAEAVTILSRNNASKTTSQIVEVTTKLLHEQNRNIKST